MKKPIVLTILALFLALAAGYVVYTKRDASPQENEVVPVNEQVATPAARNDLPDMLPLKLPDGSQVLAKTLTGKTVLVVFLPDCDHCQREAEQIQEHLADFKEYNLYFISSAPVDQLQDFARKYKLSGLSNVVFAQTAPAYITHSFGYIPTPSLYIYTEGRLIKEFKGETSIDAIVATIKNQG